MEWKCSPCVENEFTSMMCFTTFSTEAVFVQLRVKRNGNYRRHDIVIVVVGAC